MARENVGQRAIGKRLTRLAVRKLAHDDGLRTPGIFVTDKHTNISFIVDTVVDTCLYPRNRIRGPAKKCDYELFAAN